MHKKLCCLLTIRRPFYVPAGKIWEASIQGSWQNVPMRGGRILAIDYGSRNIGLACCDELGISIRPLSSVRPASRRDLLSRLRRTIVENEIQELVIGIPLNMDGSSGASVQKVESFIESLQGEFHLPLRRVDERLSTLEAMELWMRMNPKQQRKYRTVDSLSAALILQRYLEEY